MRVVNVVATAALQREVDLRAVLKSCPEAVYKLGKLPCVSFKLSEPAATVLIFKNGKMVCTGAKSEEGALEAISRATQMLVEWGAAAPGGAKAAIQNVVASGSFGRPVNIERAAPLLWEFFPNVMYYPDVYPGLICWTRNPRAAITLFSNGKFICSGVRSEVDARRAVRKLRRALEACGFL